MEQEKKDDLFAEIKLPPEMKGISLDKESLFRLGSERWLNDTIIDAYGLYLSRIKFAAKENVVILSSFFMPSLLRAFDSNENEQLRGIQRPKSLDIFKKDLVLCPALVSENHWILILITNPNHISYIVREFLRSNPSGAFRHGDSLTIYKYSKPQLIIIDSYPAASYDARRIFAALKRFLEVEFYRHMPIKIEIREVLLPGEVLQRSPQKNTSDCGVHVLHNIELIMETIPSPYSFTYDIIPDFEAELMEGKRRAILGVFLTMIRSQSH